MRWMQAAATALGVVLLISSYPSRVQAQQRPTDEQIEASVARGVAFLRSAQTREGTWPYTSMTFDHDVGCTALVALALLESDVDRNDPCIRRAADVIRGATNRLTSVYALSLAIMFLDRYTDGKDSAAIQSLAYRLASEQEPATGGWSYGRGVGNINNAQWQAFLRTNRNKTVRDFGAYKGGGLADNSNTQFALLALWIARRHKIQSEYALALAEWRFRNTQQQDGGWDYGVAIPGSTGAMTCAGLIGLAVGFANNKARAQLKAGGGLDDGPKGGINEPPDIRLDPQVTKGKTYLAARLQGATPTEQHFLYFLWTLERTCVLYKWDNINGIDWYAFGTAHLLQMQGQDGSWTQEASPAVSTSFALLFLRKANLFKDIDVSGRANIRGATSLDNNPKPAGVGTATKPAADANKYKEIAWDKAPAEAAKLAKEILTAKPERQEEILNILEFTKDASGNFTQTLIDVIPQLQDKTQGRAREALAGRYSRQPVRSIKDRLTDTNVDVQVAAIRAAALKVLQARKEQELEDLQLMPELIPLLEHSNETVAAAAEGALKEMSTKDFGRNTERWKEFWMSRKR